MEVTENFNFNTRWKFRNPHLFRSANLLKVDFISGPSLQIRRKIINVGFANSVYFEDEG
jgi:hypothetical protein